MKHEILPLAKKLIRIRSVSGNQEALKEALDFALRQVKGYSIERFNDGAVESALAYNTKSRPRKFRLLINAHLDVVGYKDHQFIPRVKGGKLYGAGALDMKASAACLITAFNDFARNVEYPVGLQLVTDEETGGFHGTKYQIAKGVKAEFVLAGEPTNFDIVNKAKGVLLLAVSAKGVTAHGAYPARGENAILKMSDFLQNLQKQYPVPSKGSWTTTVNVATIETKNRSLNKIPDDCSVSLDVRYVPGDSAMVIKKIKKLLPSGVTIKIIANEPPLLTAPNGPVDYLKKIGKKNIGRTIIIRAGQGTSDARHFSRVGCPGVEFGPVGGDIGGDKEWVDIASLGENYEIIKDLILYLGGEDHLELSPQKEKAPDGDGTP